MPKAGNSQPQLINITNREDSENVVSASARKLQSLNKMNISTATTDVDDIEKNNSMWIKIYHHVIYFVDSGILKSIVTIIGLVQNVKGS